ncbi:leucine-rich repeat extensin-like protein 5 [Ischnura elegans]|uniref:leucine-rich repeat extensin-like protein 5 n=1 Tax=Ischnura elegans TaxID=197161 RepID=UPI001ED8ADDA|nr:leucine-rich repeat extensin-like protein 5 [Ischnura elegans]
MSPGGRGAAVLRVLTRRRLRRRMKRRWRTKEEEEAPTTAVVPTAPDGNETAREGGVAGQAAIHSSRSSALRPLPSCRTPRRAAANRLTGDPSASTAPPQPRRPAITLSPGSGNPPPAPPRHHAAPLTDESRTMPPRSPGLPCRSAAPGSGEEGRVDSAAPQARRPEGIDGGGPVIRLGERSPAPPPPSHLHHHRRPLKMLPLPLRPFRPSIAFSLPVFLLAALTFQTGECSLSPCSVCVCVREVSRSACT